MPDLDALSLIGIDTEEGIAFCADDPEFYEEMLREFLDESSAKYDDLRKSFTDHDWHLYGICAHSIKSTAKMIGAKTLSERAREMEFAAKERNEAVLAAGHDRFLSEYMELISVLQSIFNAEG